jgi:hypothetical protein
MNKPNISEYIDSTNSSVNERKEQIKQKLEQLDQDYEQKKKALLEISRIQTNLAKEYNFSDQVLNSVGLYSAYCNACMKIKVPDIKTALAVLKTIEHQLLEIICYKGSTTTFQPLILEYRDKQPRYLEHTKEKLACGSFLFNVNGYRSAGRDEQEFRFFLAAGEHDIIDCEIELAQPWREIYRETEWKHHSTRHSTSPTRVATYLHQRSRTWFNRKNIWGACHDQPNTYTLSLPVHEDIDSFYEQVEAVELSGVGCEVVN